DSHEADVVDLLVGLNRLRHLHRQEVHGQEDRSDEGKLDCRNTATVASEPGNAGPYPCDSVLCPCAKRHDTLPFRRPHSSNGSFCQVTDAKCSVVPPFRLAMDLAMKSVMTGHL